MTTDLDTWQWLLSNDGAAAIGKAAVMKATGATTLRVSEQLRGSLTPEQSALVLTQLDLRARAQEKFPDADRLVFTRPGLEQATSSRIASWRAGRFGERKHIVDLCCGIGGDAMALAALPHRPRITLVDRDPVHLLLAEHNVRTIAPDADVNALLADVQDVDLSDADAVFIDPARRTERGRMHHAESDPPLDWALSLADTVPAVGIKAAPGIDIADVPFDWELEMIAIGFDLKEAALWSPALADQAYNAQARSATVLDDDGVHHFFSGHCDMILPVPLKPGNWLLDLNPAITRAGIVIDFACVTESGLIDPRIGFLVASEYIDTPFSRAMRIIDVLPWHEKRLKTRLRELDAGPVDIRRRGLAGDVDAITRRLRGDGSRRITVAMTRVYDAPTAIICEHPS